MIVVAAYGVYEDSIIFPKMIIVRLNFNALLIFEMHLQIVNFVILIKAGRKRKNVLSHDDCKGNSSDP